MTKMSQLVFAHILNCCFSAETSKC